MTNFSNKKKIDYTAICIYNKNRSVRLQNTIKTLDGYSLRKKVENENNIKLTASLVYDMNETKNLIYENSVDKVLFNRRHSAKERNIKHVGDDLSRTKNDPKLMLLERKKLVQSAPINRNVINNVEVKTSNIDPEEISVKSNDEVDIMKNVAKKTILRKQQPLSNMSMDVDKWIEIHRRSKSAGTSKENKIVNFKKEDEIKQKQKQKNSSIFTSGSTGRSRRELSELTLLDKVRQRNKKLQEERFKELMRLKRKDEFNQIVFKIRNFLVRIEKFKNNAGLDDSFDLLPQRQNFLKLYEYA